MDQGISKSYHLLKFLGLNFSEQEYGHIRFWELFTYAFRNLKNACLLKYCMYSVIFSPFNYRKIRPMLWRWMGAKVGKDCFIGYEVWVDLTHANLVVLEDHVHIANRCLLLCHQRDLSNYHKGDDSAKLPYRKGNIHFKKGCLIGMNTTVLPGVTIGEGAVIGAGSLVTKDIPDWTVAIGVPAKVMKNIVPREIQCDAEN